ASPRPRTEGTMLGENESAFVPIAALAGAGVSGLDKKSVAAVQDEIRTAYTADDRPWVIGYSGGKDSTATLQIVGYALANLPVEKRAKPVYVIAADTLVEAPAIVSFIDRTLDQINEGAARDEMPFRA